LRNDAEEYRRWERRCLEEAELCQQPEARAACRSLAGNYRIAAAEIEAQTARPVDLWSRILKTPYFSKLVG
jgi:hypothetical protein